MGVGEQTSEQKFPFPFEETYDALLRVLPSLGFTVKDDDKVIGRITASTGLNFWTMGENLTLRVEKIDEKSTLLKMEASIKGFIGVASAAHRHRKNFDRIIAGLSAALQGRR